MNLNIREIVKINQKLHFTSRAVYNFLFEKTNTFTFLNFFIYLHYELRDH